MSLECRLLSETDLFEERVWRDVEGLAPYGVFSHRALISHWWRAFGRGRTALPLLVFDQGDAVAFLPMCVSDQPYFRGLLRVRELRFFMDEFLVSAPRAPLLVRPDWAGRLAEILAAAVSFVLSRKDVRVERVCLGLLTEPVDLPCERALEEEFIVRLAQGGQDALGGVPPQTARNVRRRLRFIDGEYPGRWLMESGKPDAHLARRFVEIKCANWSGPGRCTFADPRLAAFVAGSFPECEHARCIVCRIDGEIAGIDLVLTGPDEVLSYASCFDRRYSALGIGRLLTYEIMENFRQSKSDFSLGLGEDPFKADWGARAHARYRVCIWRNAAKKAAFAAATRLKRLFRFPKRDHRDP
jgi:CelD/BcsL family acetyltransferase involved in cellulose biosynthesis